MYNGIGLQTARGSGTNGYIQSNKFFVRHKLSKVVTDPSSFKSFESGQGTAGISRKPNREILEHDRKRQIELKLLVLEEKLTDQGYTDFEVAEKLQEARINLEAQADDEDGDAGAVFGSEKRVSDTQTHQIAARKEKQMETLRAALGIGAETENQKQQPDVPAPDFEDIGDDDELIKSHKRDALGGNKHGKDAVKNMDEAKKGSKYKKDKARRSELDEPKRHKKKEKSRGRHEESSESDSEVNAMKESKKKHNRSAHISESDDESDVDVRRRRRQKSSVKQSRSRRRHDSDSSDSESDSKSDSDSSSDSGRDKKYGKSLKRHVSDDDYSSDEDSKIKSQKVKIISRRGRHDFEDESGSDIERKDRRNQSEKKRNEQRTAFMSEKDDNVRDDHRVGKERRDKDAGRYGLKSEPESDKPLKVRDKLEKSRRRHDSDEDEPGSYGEKEEKNVLSEKKRSDQRTAFRSEKDDIVLDDHRYGRSDRRLDDLNDKGRKTGERNARGHDENIKHKKAAQKVDDGGLDTLKDLEKVYQSRDEKVDRSRYGGQEPKQIKRKTGDDVEWDEQPERKTRRRDLGKEEAELGGSKNEPERKRSPRKKEVQRSPDNPSDRRGTVQSKVELRNESSGPEQDHDLNSRGKRESDNDKEQGRKHRRDEEEDEYREHQPERHGREEEDGRVSRYGRDRDMDSSKRARYDDSRSSGRRYDDDRRDDSRSSGRRYDDDRRDDSRSRRYK